MLSIGTESVILSLSCAGFLRYPGVDMMTLSTVWNARRRCRFGGSYPRSARALLQDIWISTDVAVAGETRHAPQSQDNSANHEEIRPLGRNSPPEKMGSGEATTAQI